MFKYRTPIDPLCAVASYNMQMKLANLFLQKNHKEGKGKKSFFLFKERSQIFGSSSDRSHVIPNTNTGHIVCVL